MPGSHNKHGIPKAGRALRGLCAGLRWAAPTGQEISQGLQVCALSVRSSEKTATEESEPRGPTTDKVRFTGLVKCSEI